jgi:hypothetical protein
MMQTPKENYEKTKKRKRSSTIVFLQGTFAPPFESLARDFVSGRREDPLPAGL